MKNFVTFICFILLAAPLSAQEALQNVGIAKYAVLEATSRYTPVRDNPNDNAKRLTHLTPGTVLYADKKNENFFRVEFARDEYGWVNKNLVEVQAIINDRIISKIEKVKFDYDKNFTYIKVKSEMPTAYRTFDNDGLEVNLYDTVFNPSVIKSSNKPGSIKISTNPDGSMNIKYTSTRQLWDYDAYYDKDEFIFKIRNTPKINPRKPLKNLVIVVDPGHGGNEIGAVSKDGTREKDINLQLSKRLKKELEKGGARVYLTRKRDKYVDLYDRVDFAKEKEALILISMHQNSLPKGTPEGSRRGTGVYYYNNNAKKLAEIVQRQMVSDLKVPDDGVHYASFALNRPTSPISILIENLYIINPDECALLKSKKFQIKLAKSIRTGLEKYMISH